MTVLDLYKENSNVKECIESFKKSNNILITNTMFNHNILLTLLKYENSNSSVIFVAENLYKATTAYESFCDLIGIEHVNFYVTDEIVAVEALAISNEFKYERLYTINSIINNEKKIIVTYISSALRSLPPIEVFKDNSIKIKEKDIINVNKLIKQLIILGYTRTPTTQKTGEFSVRGEVIDIFPINSNVPFRIDLFDNEIEVIKMFDINTQRSIERTQEFKIFPLNELIYEYNDNIINDIKKDLPKDIDITIFNSDFEDLKNNKCNERLYKFINYIYKKTYTLIDYLPTSTIIFDEYNQINDAYEKTIEEINEYVMSKSEYSQLNLSFVNDINLLIGNDHQKIYLTNFKKTLNNIKLDKILTLDAKDIVNYNNNIKYLIEDISLQKNTIVIALSKDLTCNLIKESFNINNVKYNEDGNIKENQINIIKEQNFISFGFINGLTVLTEDVIFKKTKTKQVKYRSVYQNSSPINSKEDLKPGDYVVHYDYGIGQYKGLESVELKGMTNDYLSIKFANMDLYVPIERINLIEKYQGTEGSVPKLSSIGTKEWEKRKKKIQDKVESIAEDLINLQAEREKNVGFTYQVDDDIQEQFENDFEFEPTPDQLKSITEIKKDMEAGKIVDRLVCGDVGYGKTEVAIRIAMKTVLNGKQVAYLAPTTILTRQHFQTFTQRFEPYGIKVALLNRLITPKQQDEIIEGIKNKDIDIVIGTHSLLSDKIKFKDLGLLIIDEEQRFGVTHKEKIKKLKTNVNVLTLTDTPIPRTLQMSIMGVRQLSLMETPPQNRYPVQTYVLEKNDTVIRGAIYREIGRGGQVFYMHNRIEELDLVYAKLRKIVPDARIIMAHGQMSHNELEDSIQSFVDHEYDVLLCTTIIETGIDIPNTNTLIVDMSDRLGLAQMYQIRGRVGRSSRVSYAYFMFEKNKVLTETSAKRLQAIKEFTTLGSGYKIAVRDLAIRGAGDILGKEQSGFIDTIGLDLYMKMLSEALKKKQGMETIETNEPTYKINISKHVSNRYVSDDDVKIYIHKEIKHIESLDEKHKIEAELIDRFGPLTEEIKIYINKQYMESLANQVGVESIEEKDAYVKVTFISNTKIDAGTLFKQAYQISDRFVFEYVSRKIVMCLNGETSSKQWIKVLITLFEKLI